MLGNHYRKILIEAFRKVHGRAAPDYACSNRQLAVFIYRVYGGSNPDRMSDTQRRRYLKKTAAKLLQERLEVKRHAEEWQKNRQQAGYIKSDVFYQSERWRKLRYQALVREGGNCQACGRDRTDGVKLHVDHIKSRFKYPGLQWELSNLQVLCEDCNLGKGWEDESDWRV